MTRVVVAADYHCGHRSGLTPPTWQYGEDGDPLINKFGEFQRKIWDWYVAKLEELHPIDTFIVNGDAIDGKGGRSGGTELITADRHVQVQMAAKCIAAARPKRTYIIKGTPYHSGEEEDWEEVLGDMVGADHVGNHEWFDAEGVILDCRHQVSGAVIPHGRYTSLARHALWNALWDERQMQPRADIIIRSHRHFYAYCGDVRWLAISTPALQLYTKYGSNIVEGTNDLGLISIDAEGGKYQWTAHLIDLRFAAARTLQA